MRDEEWARLRRYMVEEQLIPRGIDDERVLASMGSVPRHFFVPEPYRNYSYEDGPLGIGVGQTISQPFIVAQMCQLARLKPTDRVLEVGTGSGYGAAVLRGIVDEVYTIERLSELVEHAKQSWEAAGTQLITVVEGDGSLGLPNGAPYDAIIVTAASPSVPPSLVKQLAPMGRLIIPVGDRMVQQMVRITKQTDGSLMQETLEGVRFVPLLGDEGWNPDS